MSGKRLEVGDLVWTKMKNYPYWPSKIVNPPPNIKTPSAKKAQYCVFFFGTGDYAWMSGDFIVPHSDEMVLSSKKGTKKISAALQNAIDEIIEISKNSSDECVTSPRNGETDNEAEDVSQNSSTLIAVKKVGKKKVVKKKVAVKEKPPMKEISTDESSYNNLSKSSSEESITAAVNGDNETESEGIENEENENEENENEGNEIEENEIEENEIEENEIEENENEENEMEENEMEENEMEENEMEENEMEENEMKENEMEENEIEENEIEENENEENENEKYENEENENVKTENEKIENENEENQKEENQKEKHEKEEILSSASDCTTSTGKKVKRVRKKVNVAQKRAKENLPNKSSKRKCPSLPRKVMTVDDYALLVDNLPPFEDFDLDDRSNYVERPPTPVLDLMKASEFLNSKDITPTDKKIGFLGLGMIGRGVVKNLILSGHKVTVWNRNPVKCEPFVKAGACKGLTPADVVASCDITFCCVSDTMAAKTLVFESCGVLKGFEGCTVGTKGYVEMTSIDPVTSLEISRGVTSLGGLYLEAPVIGSRKLADEGALLSLVAGDRELFNDCYSCFIAFTRNVYYLSSIVGNGSKMNLIQSMLFGTTSAALAEAMALVESCDLSQARFLEILDMTPLNCPLVIDKASAMTMRDFTTNTALKHQQKDLSLVLKLGDAYRQSTTTTSAANQVFKRAGMLNYNDHDVSAVIMGAQKG